MRAGTLRIEGSTLEGNSAAGQSGGAIALSEGGVTIAYCALSRNTAGLLAGAVYVLRWGRP